MIDYEIQIHGELTLLLWIAHTKDDVVNGLLSGTLIGIRLITIGGQPAGLGTPATAFQAISASLPAVKANYIVICARMSSTTLCLEVLQYLR